MTSRTVTVTCPSCRITREISAERIPRGAVNASCRACGHQFPISPEPVPQAEDVSLSGFQFEVPPPTAAIAESKATSPLDARPARSSFVSAVAWVFIILCGFATLISIMQNVMINMVFPTDEMQKATTDPGFQQMPAFFRFMMGNVRVFFASFLVVTASMLAASVGLLKRKNWARLVFITFLSLGIVWNIVGMGLQFSMMQDFPKPAGAPPDFATTFTTMRNAIMAFSALMALVFSVFFGWLIKRLTSAEIRQEFSAE